MAVLPYWLCYPIVSVLFICIKSYSSSHVGLFLSTAFRRKRGNINLGLSLCPSVVLWFPCSNCSKNCLISSKFGMQVHKDNSQAKFEGQCDSCIFKHIN